MDAITKYYEESSYSKPLTTGDMAIPVHIIGQEIKESYKFNSVSAGETENLAELKDLDKSYFEDYRWQIVAFGLAIYTDRIHIKSSRRRRRNVWKF